MKESVFKSLQIVSEAGDKGINLVSLRHQYEDKYKISFNPRIIGELTAGSTPNCVLRSGTMVITPQGVENLKLGKFESDGTEPEPPQPEEATPTPSPPKKKPKTIKTEFVESGNEVSVTVYAIESGKNLLLPGPTGCGKTFLIEEMSKYYKKKLWTINCDVELDKTEIVGHNNLTSEDGASVTEWVKGIIQVAMENGDWVVFDEIDMVRSEVASVIHSALDHRRTLTIKEHKNEEVVAHKDFRCFATMNIGNLNPALRRRFQVIIDMNYLPPDKEKELLISRTGIDKRTAEKCVNMARDTRALAKKGNISVAVSTAHLLEFAQMLKEETFTPMECAIVTLNVSDDPNECQDILNCVRSYF